MRAPFLALSALALGLVAAAPAHAQTVGVRVGVTYAQPYYGYAQPYGYARPYGYRSYPTYRPYQPPVAREDVLESWYERHTIRELAPQ